MQSAQWIRTARMLRCAGFGTTGKAVDKVVDSESLASAASALLNTPFHEDKGALATPMPEFNSALPLGDLSKSDNKQFIEKKRRQYDELTTWWVRRMLAAQESTIEKLTFVWHDHFATRIGSVRSAQLMAKQNESLRQYCLGDFRDLAYSMLTDGAMLRWLNGNSNTAKSPNENLAREFMELFALGHGGGYTERDVREAARALTGWTVASDETIRFQTDRHDFGNKSILGVDGNHDAAAICDIVLAQPNSPVFVASSLWQQLVSDSPPGEKTLVELTKAYGPERDLKSLTLAILTSNEFLEGESTLVSGPVNWLVGLLRTLQVPADKADVDQNVVSRLRTLGQIPFDPPTVGGWARGQAWLSTSTASLRLRAAEMAVKYGDFSTVSDAPESDRIDAVGYLLGVGRWTDRSVEAMVKHAKDASRLVVVAANTPEYLTN